ncbi:RNase III domain-containing protein [Plectosphaerella cucumerina]|uniref:RNase III domain-containing protein n=1 Tax=Plectosphaerella cucumerina TaxID=40658 RepID=A0A8K0X7I1_9PEZI|nr:RNase III domain-containing protein [Plectosphaerella cucumerina]
MAANTSRTAAFALSRRAAQQCSSSSRPAFPLKRTARAFTTTPATAQTESATKIDELSRRTLESERPGDLKETRPRWSYTPEGMKAPFSPHVVKDPSRKIWKVNSDPVKLDQMYLRLLGKGGDKLLPEEIKWLAITHKSFDQGRRGFNDRLAFLGRQAIILEVSQSILAGAQVEAAVVPDSHGREAFQHPALSRLDNFNAKLPQDIVTREKIERLAIDVGLDKVVRWKPRLPGNLAASGQTIVLNGTIHAIIGAISLQHGAEVAGKIVRERILSQLDLQ